MLLPFPPVLSATCKILLTTRTNSVTIRNNFLVMFLLRNTQFQSQKLLHSIRGSDVASIVKPICRPHPAAVHCLQLHTKIAESGGDAEFTQITKDGEANSITRTPPKNARVVICGGGVMGASVAYHLALAGWGPHTVIIEQGQ